jgi:endonuclease/exonuclease/phosphatase (EEP) superfamily protein YafD
MRTAPHRWRLLVLAATLLAVVVAPTPGSAASGGEFSLLTYNVAGLPALLSSSEPATNTPLIGARITAFDVVNVQEDFNYHAALYRADNHPHRTPTSGGVPFGSGLNTLSRFPISGLTRVKWKRCNGTDCLTPKGFTLLRVELAPGVLLDVYNLHTNAGSTDADLAARRANLDQLGTYLKAHSAGNAVIVAGDTNTRYTRTGDNIRDLVAGAGLTDAWVALDRGGVPPALGAPALVCDPAAVTDACEVVDKVLFRSSARLTLTATDHHNEHAGFLRPDGKPLSDHYPHRTTFRWTAA